VRWRIRRSDILLPSWLGIHRPLWYPVACYRLVTRPQLVWSCWTLRGPHQPGKRYYTSGLYISCQLRHHLSHLTPHPPLGGAGLWVGCVHYETTRTYCKHILEELNEVLFLFKYCDIIYCGMCSLRNRRIEFIRQLLQSHSILFRQPGCSSIYWYI